MHGKKVIINISMS